MTASDLQIPGKLIRCEDIAFDGVPLVQLTHKARWAIARIGLGAYLASLDTRSPARYDD